MMEIVEIWQNLEKNATQIMIFLLHYTWAENNNNILSIPLCNQFQQTAEPNTMGASSQTGNDLVPMTSSMAQTCERGFVNSVTSQTERSFLKGDTSDKWCQFPLLEAKVRSSVGPCDLYPPSDHGGK